ncbi:uncharacterized protein Nmag_1631 [Natrialba magadii ATCC 43099]|uniref:Fibronectin type-III domain-containing protein n=1 Tax=Natrialba magadii (strain ATCC 43099 / DSM 3394 / CCM 3739 / CIP 104546 / IAM 13178 / JCM 8861 / NBRC 102185 / NCIMB 2190 / MS3) TaxID=547559 RepID=D3SUE9_NATMM|nr:fibronectin type III domain-containing protein [Natrialba magadii]ADD05207.1 uncharacterized protein Nmag_1631 [Natrialba magadii ATCC 43099]ELY23243.1 hypothetical protein C500_20676 [Natrialba magadii ATCC 43099]
MAPVTFTTDLPDAEGLALDASEVETLGTLWDAALNNGEYRLEVRDDDPDGDHPDYEHEVTIAHDADLDHTIEDILAGEQYSIRIRTQTDYVTGEWLAAEEITKLVPTDPPVETDTEPTSVSIGWDDIAEFRGSYQIRRRHVTYDRDWELVGTVSDTTTSFIDETVYPDKEYEYIIRTQTQWMFADSDASETIRTADLELARRAVPPRGWHTELEHPSGTTITPQILDGAQIQPRVNALPETTIPVPKDDVHFADSYEGIPMAVWKDGDRRPVDEVEDVVAKPDRDELVGVGGTQLERRVQEDIIAEPAHELAERLIDEYTDYETEITPPDSERTEALAQDPSTAEDWHDLTEFTDLSEIPIAINDDESRPELTNSNILVDMSNDQLWDSSGSSSTSGDEYAGGSAEELDPGDMIERVAPIEIEHTIPEEYVRPAIRGQSESGNTQITLTLIDHETDEEVASQVIWAGTGSTPLFWSAPEDDGNLADLGYTDEWSSGDIPPGTYRIRLEAADFNDNSFTADLVSLHDDRYDYLFDDDTTVPSDDDPYLDGPAYKPDSESVVVDQYAAVLSVAGGTLDVEMDDTSGDQAIAISNDAVDWVEASNATTVNGEFDDLTGELFVRITLSRYGDAGEGETPRYGQEGQAVDSYELTAILDDTPIVLNRDLDGDLDEEIAAVAEDADALYEIRQDDDQTVVHWASPGQRESDRELPIEDYEVTKESRRILHATVKGGRNNVEDEEIDAVAGEAVSLEEENIITGTERVRSAEDGTRYRPNLDYQLRTGAGGLDIRESGGIADGEELVVDYEYNVSGSYEHDDYDGDPRTEIVEEIPQATTERACAQAARVLVDELHEPRYEAQLTIPAGEAIDGLLGALDLEGLPGGPLSVYEVDETPAGLELRLGSRSRVSDVVQQIQSQLAATSQRV